MLSSQTNVLLCQKLHYFQMTTEKMAKGFLTPTGSAKYSNTHDAFELFVRTAKVRANLQQICGFPRTPVFANYLDGLRSIALAIENLSPEGEPHPNPEYPWEVNGKIVTPLEYDFPGLKLTDLKIRRMLLFLGKCYELIERES